MKRGLSPRLLSTWRRLAQEDQANAQELLLSYGQPTSKFVANYWDSSAELFDEARRLGWPISLASAKHLWTESDEVCMAMIKITGKSRTLIDAPAEVSPLQATGPTPRFPLCVGWKRKAVVLPASAASSSLTGKEGLQQFRLMEEMWETLLSLGTASGWHKELCLDGGLAAQAQGSSG